MSTETQTVSWELLFNLVVIGFNLLTFLPDICKLNLDNSALKVDMFIVYIFQFVLFLSSLYSFRQVTVTERAGQALDIMSSITSRELRSYDGVVAVVSTK